MARIVLGIATSHSPMLLSEPVIWLERGEQDRTNPLLRGYEGEEISYAEVLGRADKATIASELEAATLAKRHEANQQAMEAVAKTFAEAEVDLVIVIGDDHHEVFHDDNMPSLSIYWGGTIPFKPKGPLRWYFQSTPRSPLWYFAEEREYPVAADHALRLIGDLLAADFDVAHANVFREGQGMSHSYAYYYRAVAREATTPMIPVSINTYFPPNQMSPGRAYRLGGAMRAAVESWPEDIRVAVVATGGLSHFLVDQDLDKRFLDVMANGSYKDHADFPINKLQSGNSELRSWSALAGAVSHLDMKLIDYVPCYRSEAGTGCGMAFASWS